MLTATTDVNRRRAIWEQEAQWAVWSAFHHQTLHKMWIPAAFRLSYAYAPQRAGPYPGSRLRHSVRQGGKEMAAELPGSHGLYPVSCLMEAAQAARRPAMAQE